MIRPHPTSGHLVECNKAQCRQCEHVKVCYFVPLGYVCKSCIQEIDRYAKEVRAKVEKARENGEGEIQI